MNTLFVRRASVFTLWLWVFLWLPAPALAQAPNDGSAWCRFKWGLMDCAGESCQAARHRLGLVIGGRRYSPIADLLTHPRLRPYELYLQAALPQIREMATASPEFRRAMIRMAKGMPPANLEPVLKYLFDPPDSESTKRTDGTRLLDKIHKITQSTNLVRALGEIGVLSHDFTGMTKGLADGRDPAEQGKEFKRRAADFIARRIGDNIGKLFDVTDRLDPSTSGNLFEAWLTQNYFPQAIGRMHLSTKGLKGTYTRQIVHSDNLMDGGDGWTIVEMKHLRTSNSFDEDQLNQASNYANLIGNQIEYAPKGQVKKPIKKVIYVFSSRVAAEKNAPEIRSRLGLAAEIRYIDRSASQMLVLKGN